jgi:hypothetical protein
MRAGRASIACLVALAAVARCTSQSNPTVDSGSDAATETGSPIDAGADVSDSATCALAAPFPSLDVQCDAGMGPTMLCLNPTSITCASNPMDCDSGIFLMCGAGSALCGGNACCLDPTAGIDGGCPDTVTLLAGAMNATMCGGGNVCPGAHVCSTNADCPTTAPTCVGAVFATTTVNFGICH